MGDLDSGFLVPIGLFILFSLTAVYLYRIPIRFSLSGSRKEDSTDFHASIGWGAVDLQVSPSDNRWQAEVRIQTSVLYRKVLEQEPADIIPSPEPERKLPFRDMFHYIPLVKRILPVLIHHIGIRSITGDIRFGAGDPVTTGQVFGYYHAIRPLVAGDSCFLNLTPDFTRLILEGEAGIVITINRPLGMGVKIAAILLPAMWKEMMPRKVVLKQGGAFA